MDIYLFSLVILAGLAVMDLVVGVANDAVNFVNSSIGSRVASHHVVMFIAGMGMLAGVTFSSGMMEVARKGIFHPSLFTMPELMTIFLAVMLSDVLLLDFFNTFGLPTSTTVSLIFDLLGAAVAVSLLKIMHAGADYSALVDHINTSKVLAIISGILLSVAVSFVFGVIIQFFTRLTFTFDYFPRIKRYGGIWAGISLSAITYFILIKGAKGASFLSPATLEWINTHTWVILWASCAIFAALFQILISFTKINILKPIVLVGTFAMAMAFAANDLVNFIGVPLAGLGAYMTAQGVANPLTATMEALEQPVQTNTYLLLVAGIIMVITLWTSKKARTVTKTEVRLGRQDEGNEYYESSMLSRVIVRIVAFHFELLKKIIPAAVRQWIAGRLDATVPNTDPSQTKKASFDLLRASVNLMVSSALVSYGTAHKLPLSTTYVTFMVAMGTSLADQAWGRESAVYRVTGVLTVVGGWFVTAFIAFSVALTIAGIIYYLKFPAVLALMVLAVLLMRHNTRLHTKREQETETIEAFSLKQVNDVHVAVKMTFENLGHFLNVVRVNLDACFAGLFAENRAVLKETRRETKKIQKWANVIIANLFKTIYLMEKANMVPRPRRFSQTIRSLQAIAESHRDFILRAYTHVENNHSPLLPGQREELTRLRSLLFDLLTDAANLSLCNSEVCYADLKAKCGHVETIVTELDQLQAQRIQQAQSKTRLSILFYGFLEDSRKLAQQTLDLLALYQDTSRIDLSLKVPLKAEAGHSLSQCN